MGRSHQERDPRDRREPDPDRQAAEPRDGRDIDGRDPRGGVEPESDGGAGECGEAQGVTERVGDERGKEDAAVVDRLAQVPERQDVVEAQQPVARSRERECRQHVPPGNRVQMAEYVLQMELRELPMEDVHDQCKYEQGRERPYPTQCAALFVLIHRARFIEPRFIEPRFIEPRFIEPRFIEPRFIESGACT